MHVSLTYWRDPDLPDIEVGLGISNAHAFPRHRHDDVYLVGCMERGGSWCDKQGDENSLVAPGDLCLVNPGQIHSGIPAGKRYPTYRTITVGADWFREVARDVFQGESGYPEFTGMSGKRSPVWGVMRQAIGLVGGKEEKLEKQSLLVTAFARLATHHCRIRDRLGPAGRESAALRRAREFLAEDLAARISLDEAARVAGLSRYHFLREFKSAVGLPPHVYRVQRRIEAARDLLGKRVPFAEIALTTGFSDQSHFSNTFKKYTGTTPGQYLAAMP